VVAQDAKEAFGPQRRVRCAGSDTAAATAVATRRRLSSTVESTGAPSGCFSRYFMSQIWVAISPGSATTDLPQNGIPQRMGVRSGSVNQTQWQTPGARHSHPA